MARAILITGGNIGDVKQLLRRAQQMINSEIGIVMRCSHMYYSKSWGFTSETDFWNQALIVDTELNPEELLEAVQKIEAKLGRDRTEEVKTKNMTGEKYSSRVMDIDILFYDNLILNTPSLTIPHPLMQERDFVLTPLCEIAPDKVHPVLKLTPKQLRDNLWEKNGRNPNINYV